MGVTTAATAVNKRSRADRSRQVTAKPASASIRNTKQKLTLTVRARVERQNTRPTAAATITTMSVAVIMTAATAAVSTLRNNTVNSASASIQNTKNPPEGTANVLKSVARRSTKATASATMQTTIVAVVMTVVTAALKQLRAESSTRITANSASVSILKENK